MALSPQHDSYVFNFILSIGKHVLGCRVTVKTGRDSSYTTDPFLIGCLDFQRRFGDILSNALLLAVQAVFRSSQRGLIEFRNRDNKCVDPSSEQGENDPDIYDLFRLLEHIKRYKEQYASYLNASSEYIAGICTDLLHVRNRLAHKHYLADDQKGDFTFHQRTLPFTAKYLDRGLEIMELLRKKLKEVKFHITCMHANRLMPCYFILCRIMNGFLKMLTSCESHSRNTRCTSVGLDN